MELIVGTPPGGGQDRPARAMMQVLEASGLVGVPMRLTNIAGKGGGNAWSAVRERRGDPHVLSVSSAPLVTNRILGAADFDHDALTPIATLYTEYLAFVARPDAPVRTAHELLEPLKSDPGAITIAIATAVGTTNHIALGEIVQHLGGDPQRLSLRVFESALYAVDDAVQGNADAAVVSAVSAVQALEAGTLRALAVSAPRPMGGVLGGAPTWTSLGVPCAIGQWRGIVGAPGLQPAQISYWETAFGEAARNPQWRAELERHHWTDTWKGAAETGAFLNAERTSLGRMLARMGLTR